MSNLPDNIETMVGLIRRLREQDEPITGQVMFQLFIAQEQLEADGPVLEQLAKHQVAQGPTSEATDGVLERLNNLTRCVRKIGNDEELFRADYLVSELARSMADVARLGQRLYEMELRLSGEAVKPPKPTTKGPWSSRGTNIVSFVPRNGGDAA